MKLLLKCGMTTQRIDDMLDDAVLRKSCSLICNHVGHKTEVRILSDDDNLIASKVISYSNAVDMAVQLRDLIGLFYWNDEIKPGLYKPLDGLQGSLDTDLDFTTPSEFEDFQQSFSKTTASLCKFTEELYLVYPSKNKEKITFSNIGPADVTCDSDFDELRKKLDLFNHYRESNFGTGIFLISEFGEKFCSSSEGLRDAINEWCEKNYKNGHQTFCVYTLQFIDGKLNEVKSFSIRHNLERYDSIYPDFYDNWRFFKEREE